MIMLQSFRIQKSILIYPRRRNLDHLSDLVSLHTFPNPFYKLKNTHFRHKLIDFRSEIPIFDRDCQFPVRNIHFRPKLINFRSEIPIFDRNWSNFIRNQTIFHQNESNLERLHITRNQFLSITDQFLNINADFCLKFINFLPPFNLFLTKLVKTGLIETDPNRDWSKWDWSNRTGPIGADLIGTGKIGLVHSAKMFVLCNLYNCMFYTQLNILSGSRKFQFWNLWFNPILVLEPLLYFLECCFLIGQSRIF